MNIRVKHLALFISFSAVYLGNPYSALAANTAVNTDASQTERARPVRDRTPPVITLNGNKSMTIALNTEFQDPGASALDNIDGAVTVEVYGVVNTSRPATYILSYRAVDSNGNQAVATRRVTVADTTAPVITLLGESTMSLIQGGTFTDPGATATDNIDGDVPVRVLGYVRRNVPGTYTLTYIAKDSARNEARATRIVTVVADTTPPEITLNGEGTMTLTLGSPFTDPGASATDNSNGPVSINTSGRVNTGRLGTYTLTYRARDRAGNISTVTRTVKVVRAIQTDTIPPVLTLNGDPNIELTIGEAYTETGATATDNVDGTINVTTTGSVDTTTAGTYTVTYTARDAAGNTAMLTRSVVVKPAPNVVPTVNAGAEQTVNEQTTVTLQGSANDPDGSIASYAWAQTSGSSVTLTSTDQAVTSFTAPTVNADETLSFTLTVTDNAGASAESTTTVTVKNLDATAPVLTLNGEASIELTVGDSYTEAGATATDDVDGTVNVTTTGTVDTSTTGTYTITYTATDAAGNSAALSRTVIVKAAPNQLPTVNAGADQTVDELTAVNLNGSATDPDGSIVSYAWVQVSGSSVTLATTDQGQTTFTAPDITAAEALSFKLTVTDDDGATAEDTVIINVNAIDSIKPVITLNGSAVLRMNVGSRYTEAGATASDDVDGDLNVSITGTVDTSVAGTYTVTYTATDAAGNSASINRLVYVIAVPLEGKLNDTGVTSCANADARDLLCPVDQYPDQDAQQGRDLTHNDPADGLLGFSFTKLDASGQPLADQTVDYATTPWSCVKDNVTGLMWEVKTDDGGLQDQDWRFVWYEPNIFNSGYAGTTTGGYCDVGGKCNSSTYSTRVNSTNYCGYSDWRLPTASELFGILPLESGLRFDNNFFPNATTGLPYWSIETNTVNRFQAWYIESSGFINAYNKSQYMSVRLVRGHVLKQD